MYVLIVPDLYTNTTLDIIRNAVRDGTIHKEVDSIMFRVDCHASNVRGSYFYWRNKYLEFKSAKLYGSYLKRK